MCKDVSPRHWHSLRTSYGVMKLCVIPRALTGLTQAPSAVRLLCSRTESPEGHKAHVWPGMWATVYRAALTHTTQGGALSPHHQQHARQPRLLREASARGGPCCNSHGGVRGPVLESGPSFIPSHLYVRFSEHRVLKLKDVLFILLIVDFLTHYWEKSSRYTRLWEGKA